MARPRKNNITIDEEIIKQEEQVSKSKAKYDADVKKLKDLYAKKDEMKKRELLEAVEKSSKTFEEIMGFFRTRCQVPLNFYKQTNTYLQIANVVVE